MTKGLQSLPMAIYLCPHYWSGGFDEKPVVNSTLTQQMNQSTRSIHDIADATVNAKLVLALKNPRFRNYFHDTSHEITSHLLVNLLLADDPRQVLWPLFGCFLSHISGH